MHEPTHEMVSEPLSIVVVSDVVCPWCFIGKRQLERALGEVQARDGGLAVEVRWRPFLLDPGVPEEGLAMDAYMRQRFGDPQRIKAMTARVAEMGQAAGVDFAFERIERRSSSLDAHRLIRWAEEVSPEAQGAVVEALFSAFFEQGRDIGDRAVLVELAERAGLDAEAIAARLETDEGRAQVRGEALQAAQGGVSGVPFFIMDGRLAVPGAQSHEVFLQVIDRVLALRTTPS